MREKEDMDFLNVRTFDTGALKPLDVPAVYASGRFGPHYFNTEHTLGDGGKWKEFKKPFDPVGMINYATSLTRTDDDFGRIIDILAAKIAEHLPDGKPIVFAGGETRDLLFSGPIADKFDLPHLILRKDGSVQLLCAGQVTDEPDLSGIYVPHVGDLLTTGSSTYDGRKDPATGWMPMIRGRGGEADRSYVIMDRLEGGAENLQAGGVTVTSLLQLAESYINEAFTRGAMTEAQRDNALAYKKDFFAWGSAFLKDKGIVDTMVNVFNPEGG